MKTKKTPLYLLFWSLMSFSLLASITLICGYIYLVSRLPDVETLNNIQLQVPLRIYSADNKLITEYGEKKRLPVTLDNIPKPLIQALLATEDQRYYEHPGVDILGLARAAIQIVKTGEKVQGGSTITMQVARNFFLDRKKTFVRKLNEILLAIKIDHDLSKDKILELYLNKIYLGNRAYGVAAAAQIYYGKTLKELTLAEMAMIAGIPKAPSSLNPIANPQAAKLRRDHVLARMREEGYISQSDYETAIAERIQAKYHGTQIEVSAPYVAEMIRAGLYEKFGKSIYTQGLHVYTTLDADLQTLANKVVKQHLIQYDTRHYYKQHTTRYPHLDSAKLNTWPAKLVDTPSYGSIIPAIVIKTDDFRIMAITKNSQRVTIPWQGISWARPIKNGGQNMRAADIAKKGDVIYVEKTDDFWTLRQIPDVEGAVVALNPHDGSVLALTGGFDFEKSSFNRITQAERQPGSSFKPFIYAAALDKGYTLASLVNDAPFVISGSDTEKSWRPQNSTRQFYGPTRLREGLVQSRNLVSIRLLDSISLGYATRYLTRFGFKPTQLPRNLSLALGTLSATPLDMARGYATFANGGYLVKPYIITKITNDQGKVIYEAKPEAAPSCCEQEVVEKSGMAHRVIPAQTAYQMTSALKDVINRGTAKAATVLNRHDIAGKTGTTNDKLDAWFAGFNADLVVVTWMGYDKPQSLHEYASSTALPMWIDFMGQALKDKPESNISPPVNLVTAKIDPDTGLLARHDQKNVIEEIFPDDLVPKQTSPLKGNPQNHREQRDDENIETLF